MSKRENSYVESMKFIKSLNEEAATKERSAVQEKLDKIAAWKKEYDSIITDRVKKERFHGRLLEAARNDALGSAIKAIYITAIESCGLSDDEIALAESIVDNWVTESGGTEVILSTKNQHRSYLLARLAQITEDAARRAVMEVESIKEADNDDEEDTEEKIEEEDTITVNGVKYKKVEEVEDDKQEIGDAEGDTEEVDTEEETKEVEEEPAEDEDSDDDDTSDEDDDVEEGDFPDEDLDKDTDNDDEEDTEEEEDNEDYSDELDIDFDDDDEDDSDDATDYDEVEDEEEADNEESEEGDDDTDDDIEVETSDDDDEEVSDEEQEEAGEEILDDDPNEDEDDSDVDSAEGVEDTSEEDFESDEEDDSVDSDQLYKDLEDEEDVKKAINTIQTRVADAEEKFIKKNAEDKKKVDELLHKIGNSVKTVEEIDDDDNPKSQAEQEHVQLYRRQINDITSRAPQSVFEAMAKEIGTSSYINESADEELKAESIIYKTVVLYGFLETLNTLKLEDVNPDYIKEVITQIN